MGGVARPLTAEEIEEDAWDEEMERLGVPTLWVFPSVWAVPGGGLTKVFNEPVLQVLAPFWNIPAQKGGGRWWWYDPSKGEVIVALPWDRPQ